MPTRFEIPEALGERLLFITSLLVGFTMIMGVNAVNSAPAFMLNYYKYASKSDSAEPQNKHFWKNVLTYYTVVTQVIQTLLEPTNITAFASRFSMLFRMECATIFLLTELLIIVITPHTNITQSGAMVAVMCAAASGGIGRGYFENTGFALFAAAPASCRAGGMIGVPASGALVSLLQIVLLASMSTDYEAILQQSVIYFTVSILIVSTTALMLLLLPYNAAAKKYIAEFRHNRGFWANAYRPLRAGDVQGGEGDENEEPSAEQRYRDGSSPTAIGQLPDEGAGFRELDEEEGPETIAELAMKERALDADGTAEVPQAVELGGLSTAEMVQQTRVLPIFRRIWPMMLACFLTFACTYLMYPGILIAEDPDSDWYTTMILATYNFGDLIGRSMTLLRVFWFSRRIVVGVSMGRLVFIPLIMLCALKIIPYYAIMFILTAVLGITTGVFGTLPMIYAPQTAAFLTEGERVLAGQMTDISLLMGCSVGSLVQIAAVIPFN